MGEIIRDNQDVIDESKIIRLLEIEIKKFGEINKIRLEIATNIKEDDNKINNFKKNIKTKWEPT